MEQVPTTYLVSQYQNCELSDNQISFIGNLRNKPIFSRKTANGFESNIERIDRIVNYDENTWKTYFKWNNFESDSSTIDNKGKWITKAFSTQYCYHLKITVDDKIYTFRYSTRIKNNRFFFNGLQETSSKINKDGDLDYYVFANTTTRYIIDYRKLRKNLHNSQYVFDGIDVVFTLDSIINTGCLIDIFDLQINNDNKIESFRTCNDTYQVMNYDNNVLYHHKILAYGQRHNNVVIATIKNGLFRYNKSYNSVKETKPIISKTYAIYGKTISYTGLASENRKLTNAFEKYKQDGTLPRTLPLLKIDEVHFIAIINSNIIKDNAFNDFQVAITKRLQSRKIRSKKINQINESKRTII